MRLLRYEEPEELSMHEFEEGTIPPYAILSHRWGDAKEEVTFEDLSSNNGQRKIGYNKIRFCGKQTQSDGLQYFWIDTCCINKTNKAEYSSAIRSMYRWYYNASRCYVYLSDVSVLDSSAGEAGSTTWDSAFRASKWFTRGWTLQELLAPSLVEFFTQEGVKLGDKISLIQQIHEASNIPHMALQGCQLSRFSVEDRLRWMETRTTTCPEDKAYALLGILDVDLAPCYGEGAEGAFRRLHQAIGRLRRWIYDIRDTDSRDDKKRIEEAKGGLIKETYSWVLDNIKFRQWRQSSTPESALLWIKGDPGKGKTMLVCGIINELQRSAGRTDLLCYFFCQATDSRINNATSVLRGLLYSLVNQQPALISHVREKYEDAGKTLFEDANAWVALTEILESILRDANLGTTYLLIDGLDECITDLPKLLQFISRPSGPSRIKWLVSSRNWPEIEKPLERADYDQLSLELATEHVSLAVRTFIDRKASHLAQEENYDKSTQEAVVEYLNLNADDTFLWVALVCQELQGTAKRNVRKKLKSFPPGLDALYERMMQQIDNLDEDDVELCKQILASIALVYRPVTLKELVTLVEPLEDIDSDSEVREIVSLCGSLLTLRDDVVYFVHQSAQDFLLNKEPAVKVLFPAGIEPVHNTIFLRSLRVMSKNLHRNMYNMQGFDYHIERKSQLGRDRLASLWYSCLFWVDHLRNSGIVGSVDGAELLQDGGEVESFLHQKYLYWLEALSVCKGFSSGLSALVHLQLTIQDLDKTTSIMSFVHDAYRFAMYYKGAIESSPLQVYESALLFSPEVSRVRKAFQREEPEDITINPTIGENWQACLLTLEGHSKGVNAVVYSRTWIASASSDSTIKIWDSSIGVCLRTIEGHAPGHIINNMSTSQDSAWLASACDDTTVKIWNTRDGSCLSTLKHLYSVRSVAFSHDSVLLASSHDRFIQIWDTKSGAPLQTLEGHEHDLDVTSVAFSHDSTRLVSASEDRTIKLWDMRDDGRCVQTLSEHRGPINSVLFSHDSTMLASGSDDKTIKIWTTNGNTKCLRTLEGHSYCVSAVAFSHDSTLLASASENATIRIWETRSGSCVQVLKGHSEPVYSVAFSPDSTKLVSASNDSTVKVWSVGKNLSRSHLSLQGAQKHARSITQVVFSHDMTTIATSSSDSTIKLWDVSSARCSKTLVGHSAYIGTLVMSHDSTWLASGSRDSTIKIWDLSNGSCLATLKGKNRHVNQLILSHDSTRLAAAGSNGFFQVWEMSSGTYRCLQTIKQSGGSDLITFSHNTNLLATSSEHRKGSIRIWHVSSGVCLQTLDVETRYATFDYTDSYIYTDAGVFAVVPTEQPSIAMTEAEEPIQQELGISPDRKWITRNGRKRLWLPSEYRPTGSKTFATAGNFVGIGTRSGQLFIYSFK